MKSFILTMATLVISVVGLFGVNALRVAKEDVKTAVTEMLPTEFRQKLSEQEIADQRKALAEVAATVDREVLPRYATFLAKTTFSDLEKNDFHAFRCMVANFDAGSKNLAKAMPRITSSGESDYETKKEQLEVLAESARKDLKMMVNLKARVMELNKLDDSLENTVGSLSITESPALSINRLESVKRFITDCERAATAARYESEFQKRLSGGLSHHELVELKTLMETMEVASN